MAVKKGFEAKYPGVVMDYYFAGTGKVITKITTEHQAGQVAADGPVRFTDRVTDWYRDHLSLGTVALLTAVTIVVGMRLMGVILISSLLIFPSLTSMRVFRSFRGVVLSSAAVSALCFFFGFLAAFRFDLPTGATVVAVNALAFIGFAAAGKIKRVKR